MAMKLTIFRSLVAVFALAAMFIIAGCSGDLPYTPEEYQQAGMGKIADDVFENRDTQLNEIAEKVSAIEKVTTSTGGIVSVQHNQYKHNLVVLPKAVDEDVDINIHYGKESIDDQTVAVFEFGPDGLVFHTPAVLHYEVADLDSSIKLAKLYYYDPEVGDWVLQGYSRIVNGKAKFKIRHFSKYAIAD